MVPEIECLFMSKWLVIFFFVDDIVVSGVIAPCGSHVDYVRIP